MMRLRKVFATLPMQSRPLGDPLLDPRTAAYLEPATLPVAKRSVQKAGHSKFRSLREFMRRPYPRLWAGLLFLLIMLLYLLTYAQETGSPPAPYLVVPPADSHAAQFLVQPAELGEPALPLPVTGQ
jgi:hypothetical protein